jgi:hypothetical protein
MCNAEGTIMEQKEHLRFLAANELWSLREEVDAKLARILLKRKRMLEERFEQLKPRSSKHLWEALIISERR